MEHDFLYSGRAKEPHPPSGLSAGRYIINEVWSFRGESAAKLSSNDHEFLEILKKSALLRNGAVISGISGQDLAETTGVFASAPAYETKIKPREVFSAAKNEIESQTNEIAEMEEFLSQSQAFTESQGTINVYQSQPDITNFSQETHWSAESDPNYIAPGFNPFASKPPVPSPTQLFTQLTDHGAKVYPISTSAKKDDPDLLNLYALAKAFDTTSALKFVASGDARLLDIIKNETIFVDVVSFHGRKDGDNIYGFALRADEQLIPKILLYITSYTKPNEILVSSQWARRQPNVDALASDVINERIHPLHAAAMKFAGDNLVGLLHGQKQLLVDQFGFSFDTEILTWTHDMRAAYLNALGIYPQIGEDGTVSGFDNATHLSVFARVTSRDAGFGTLEDSTITMVLFLNETSKTKEKMDKIRELIEEDNRRKEEESKEREREITRRMIEQKKTRIDNFKKHYKEYLIKLADKIPKWHRVGRFDRKVKDETDRKIADIASLQTKFAELRDEISSIYLIPTESASDTTDVNVNYIDYFGSAEPHEYSYLTLLHELDLEAISNDWPKSKMLKQKINETKKEFTPEQIIEKTKQIMANRVDSPKSKSAESMVATPLPNQNNEYMLSPNETLRRLFSPITPATGDRRPHASKKNKNSSSATPS